LTLARPNKNNAAELLWKLQAVVEGEPIIDTVAAAGMLIICVIGTASEDLPTALANIDRLADDLKDELRRRLSN
jgi:hypothetical protein